MRGRDEIRREYGAFFAACPELRGEVLHHTVVGDWVVDEECITGWEEEPVRAVAAYHLDGELVDRMLLLG